MLVGILIGYFACCIVYAVSERHEIARIRFFCWWWVIPYSILEEFVIITNYDNVINLNYWNNFAPNFKPIIKNKLYWTRIFYEKEKHPILYHLVWGLVIVKKSKKSA